MTEATKPYEMLNLDETKVVSKHVFVLQHNGLQKSFHEGRPDVDCWSVVLTDPGADTVKLEGGLDANYMHEEEGWVTSLGDTPKATLSEALVDGIQGMLEGYLDINGDDKEPEPKTPCVK
jgi:hypothetical protein